MNNTPRIHHSLVIEELEARVAPAVVHLDPTFGGDGVRITGIDGCQQGRDVAIQSDGRIVVVGCAHNGSDDDFAVIRYNSDGSLDTSFGGDGVATTDFGHTWDACNSVAIQPDGRIVVAGQSYRNVESNFAVARYNADGSLDTSFGIGGVVTTDLGGNYSSAGSVAIQPDGRIVVVGGTRYDFALARYNSDGSLDISFGADGRVTTDLGGRSEGASSVAIQPDGKIVVAGGSGCSAYDPHFALARYNTDGSLDTSFHGDGSVIINFGVCGTAYDVAIQADGKIVMAGYAEDGSGPDLALVRVNSNGVLDTSFDTDGVVTIDFAGHADYAADVAVQPDNRILVAGYAHNGSDFDLVLVRVNSDGGLDTSFDTDGVVTTDLNGPDDYALGMAVQADGKIVVAGLLYECVNHTVLRHEVAVARYCAGASPTANDDAAALLEDSGSNVIDVLVNDETTPGGGETLTITGITQGTHGTVAITCGGAKLTYTPDADYYGEDSFTYTVGDGIGGMATGTVSVTVTNVNDDPTANDDVVAVAEHSGPNPVNVLGNDTYLPDPVEALRIIGVTQGAHGSVAITGDGSGLTYTPCPCFRGCDSFTYTIDDGNGGTDTATVNVSVTDPPRLVIRDADDPGDDMAVDFGRLWVDGPDGELGTAMVAIANDGAADLMISSVSLLEGTDFAITGLPATPFWIVSGESVTATVTFDPTSTNSKNATIGIVSNDPERQTIDVSLSGFGISPLVLDETTRFFCFRDGDYDLIQLAFSGPGEVWVMTATGDAPTDGTDIAHVYLHGTTESSSFAMLDLDPAKGTPDTMLAGTVETVAGESMGVMRFVERNGTIRDTEIDIDGSLKMLQVLGNATNLDISVGVDASKIMLMGSATNSTLDIDGAAGMVQVKKGLDQTTIDVGTTLTKAMLLGGMTDSTLAVTGHATMVMGKDGQTDSTLTFDGGIDRLMLFGGLDNTDVSATGNVLKCMIKDGITNGSTVQITGNATMVQVMGGVGGGSTIGVTGDVAKAMLFGPNGGDGVAAGSTATFGSLSKMLMVKGNLAGTVDIQGSCVAAGKNSLLKVLGNLSGDLIADLFGNTMVLGDFTGNIGKNNPGGTAAGVGNWLMVKGTNTGTLLPDGSIFAEIK